MNRLGILIAVLTVTMLTVPGANAASGDEDAAFRDMARKFIGFSMFSDTPPLPDETFIDGQYRKVSFNEFKNKALLINFWATWCTPCVREMPILDKLQREFGGDSFQVVAIAAGQQVGKNPDAFLKEHNLDALDLYLDPHARLLTFMGTTTLPTTLVVDRNGRIMGGVRGEANWDSPAARAVLRHLIEK